MSVSGGSAAPSLRDDFFAELGAYHEAVERLRAVLGDGSEAMQRSLVQYRAGGAPVTVPRVIPEAEQRARISEAMTAFERSRHRMHRAYFKLLASEGMTLAEIARRQGVSRQLISRMLHESDG